MKPGCKKSCKKHKVTLVNNLIFKGQVIKHSRGLDRPTDFLRGSDKNVYKNVIIKKQKTSAYVFVL